MKWTHKSVLNLISLTNTEPIESIRSMSRDLVIKAYNQGWNGPPFDPIKLAQILGIRVIPNDNISDARIFCEEKNQFTIEYNPNQLDTRINFSIAHEIGHTFFPDWKTQIQNRTCETTIESWELEFLCNVAASEILLPYAEFNNEANSVPLNLDSIIKISNKYKASIESVFLRFCDVVEKPCSIIIASFTDVGNKKLQVEYSKSSKSSSLRIERNYLIPPSSKAYDCIHSGWTSNSFEEWPVFDANFKVYCIGLPPLKRQNRARVGILIVPNQYVDDSEPKIYMVNGDATRPRGEGNKIIAQVINTSGGLGFGFGRAMSKVWPDSKKSVINWMKEKGEFILGNSKLTQLSKDVFVYQMIAQKGIFPKGGTIPLQYDSLKKCLIELKDIATDFEASVHMPQIGAGQAKGDWGIIEGMIFEILVSNKINVTIYILPGTQIINPKKQSNLTLFDQDSLHEK